MMDPQWDHVGSVEGAKESVPRLPARGKTRPRASKRAPLQKAPVGFGADPAHVLTPKPPHWIGSHSLNLVSPLRV